MDDSSDGSLLAAFRGGDSAALSALVARHQGALLGHARSLIGDSGAHEDVVQEVFLKLVQKPPELSGDAEAQSTQLRAWLHKVVRNCCMDTLRSETRRKRREEKVASPDLAPGEVSDLEAEDTRAAVERSLSALPDDQREVLVLRLIAERSYKEIAEITGKKIGTVGWLVSVGLKTLGEQLAPLLGQGGVPVAGKALQSGAQGERS